MTVLRHPASAMFAQMSHPGGFSAPLINTVSGIEGGFEEEEATPAAREYRRKGPSVPEVISAAAVIEAFVFSPAESNYTPTSASILLDRRISTSASAVAATAVVRATAEEEAWPSIFNTRNHSDPRQHHHRYHHTLDNNSSLSPITTARSYSITTCTTGSSRSPSPFDSTDRISGQSYTGLHPHTTTTLLSPGPPLALQRDHEDLGKGPFAKSGAMQQHSQTGDRYALPVAEAGPRTGVVYDVGAVAVQTKEDAFGGEDGITATAPVLLSPSVMIAGSGIFGTDLVSEDVVPFSSKLITAAIEPSSTPPQGDDSGKQLQQGNPRYCYRHRPDLKCSRQADEIQMEALQKARIFFFFFFF